MMMHELTGRSSDWWEYGTAAVEVRTIDIKCLLSAIAIQPSSRGAVVLGFSSQPSKLIIWRISFSDGLMIIVIMVLAMPKKHLSQEP